MLCLAEAHYFRVEIVQEQVSPATEKGEILYVLEALFIKTVLSEKSYAYSFFKFEIVLEGSSDLNT